jgi:hypothetical protein
MAVIYDINDVTHIIDQTYAFELNTYLAVNVSQHQTGISTGGRAVCR